MRQKYEKKTAFILSVVTGGIGFFAGMSIVLSKEIKKRLEVKELADKHLVLVQLLGKWLAEKQRGKQLEDYFHQNGIKNIAIYGMGYVGERLYEELSNSDITVEYLIDKNAGNINTDMKIFTPDEELPKVDAVIVTPVTFFDEIEEMLAGKIACSVISIEDILYEL